jgi:hypothetical protein
MAQRNPKALVHLGAGIGNVVLGTSLLLALAEMGFTTDVWLTGDYAQTIDLLTPWSIIRAIIIDSSFDPRRSEYCYIVPAIPPFYWRDFAARFVGKFPVIARPPDTLFYRDEQQFYLSFAYSIGFPSNRRPAVCLPISAADKVSSRTLVVAPGCKTGEMAAKRWPYYAELADRFDDVVVVGTADDLCGYDAKPLRFSSHVKMFADRITLRETAELIAAAGAFVGNDSGLSHIAAAVGAPTVMIFGPTPDHTLGRFPPNVRVLRRGSSCEPCWFGARFRACAGRIDCLAEVRVDVVVSLLAELGFVRDCPEEEAINDTQNRSCPAL